MSIHMPKTLSAWAGWTAQVLLTVVFLRAGWVKVMTPAEFALSIQGYQMVPEGLIPWMTWVLPWLEIWCAVALWTVPTLRRSAWVWIVLMLVVFTLAKVSAVQRGLDISCGCTDSNTPLTWRSVAENTGWLLLALTGMFLDRPSSST